MDDILKPPAGPGTPIPFGDEPTELRTRALVAVYDCGCRVEYTAFAVFMPPLAILSQSDARAFHDDARDETKCTRRTPVLLTIEPKP